MYRTDPKRWDQLTLRTAEITPRDTLSFNSSTFTLHTNLLFGLVSPKYFYASLEHLRPSFE